jgi:uncharacterized membrane protein
LARTLREAPRSRPARILLLCWLAATLMCIALGIYQVNRGWNGIPVQPGPIRFSMTIYPPLIICLWMVFWLGFEWAFADPAEIAKTAGNALSQRADCHGPDCPNVGRIEPDSCRPRWSDPAVSS